MTTDHLAAEGQDWLIEQLKAWPTRIDPEKTTNIEYLMQQAAARLDRMTEALEKARDRFAQYADEHQDKANEAGLTGSHAEFLSRCAKSTRNREMADLCARALGGQIGEG